MDRPRHHATPDHAPVSSARRPLASHPACSILNYTLCGARRVGDSEMWGVPFPEPYMSLYNASAVALKAVSPFLKVGGPATMQTLDIAGFIANCSAMKLPMDFVSTHL
jgi:hypothetical protein